MLRDGATLGLVCKTLKISTPVLYENGIHALELRREGRKLRELAAANNTEGDNVVKFAKAQNE